MLCSFLIVYRQNHDLILQILQHWSDDLQHQRISVLWCSGRRCLWSVSAYLTDDSYLFFCYIVVLLLLLLSLTACFMCNRRAAASEVYNVEASQVHGPPTIIATEYHPTSGPSGVYGGPRSSFRNGQTGPQMTGPAYPVAAQVSKNQTRTAPVTQCTFPNPPPGYSPVSPWPLLVFVTRLLTPLYIARGTDSLRER